MFFLISQLNNDILKMFMIIFSNLIIFYSLGKVFHKYFKFETTNTYYHISSGAFIFYILLFVFQCFLISFNVDLSILLLSEKIIRLFILIFILITIKIWFNFSSFFDFKKIIGLFSYILSIAFFSILFLELQNTYEGFNNFYSDPKYLSSIELSLKSNVNDFMKDFNNLGYSVDRYFKFQYYYFNPVIKSGLYSLNQLEFIKNIVPIIFIVIINSMFFSLMFLKFKGKNIFFISIFSLLFYLCFFSLFFKINIFNQFLIPLIAFTMLVVSIFKLNENFYFDKKYLLIPMFSSILFLSSTYYSIFLIFVFLIICTTVLEQNDEDKIYSLAFFFNLFIFEILIINLNENLLQNTIFWFVFFIPILLINYQVIRKDFFKEKRAIRNDKNNSRRLITTILYGISFIVFFIFLMLNIEVRKSFLGMFSLKNNFLYKILYFLIYYPILITITVFWFYKRNILKKRIDSIFIKNIVISFILIFNPISITIILSILNLPLINFGLISTLIMILFSVMNYIINKRWI